MVLVIHVFKIIKDGNLCEKASIELNSLLKEKTNFNFECMLTRWHKIITAIDRVNMILQKQNISIVVAAKHLKGLIQFIENFREEGIVEVLKELKQKAIELFIEPVFHLILARKKKKIFGELVYMTIHQHHLKKTI